MACPKQDGEIEGQFDLSVALRVLCCIKQGFTCTYYVASQYRYLHEGEMCESTCCYGCKKKNMCGWVCNASRSGGDHINVTS